MHRRTLAGILLVGRFDHPDISFNMQVQRFQPQDTMLLVSLQNDRLSQFQLIFFVCFWTLSLKKWNPRLLDSELALL
jgi:hypothetical protein